jgi:activator of 2-hydroxyglutaryl-CoA dehydratase
MGELSLRVEKEPEPVSSMCVVFAKTEALGLLRKGWKKNDVLAAYSRAMAQRVAALLKRIGIEKEFVITGGIAKNVGIVTRLEKELGIVARKPNFDTQIAGAVGAALIAKKMKDEG